MSSMTDTGTCFEVAGRGDAPPVVLVHGLGLNRHMWHGQVDALAARYRASFKDYDESKLLVSALVYAILSTAFLGVFLTKYKIELLLSLPFVAMLFGRYLAVGLARDSIAQAPENLYKQRGLVFQVILLVVVMFVLLEIKLPFFEQLLEIRPVGS